MRHIAFLRTCCYARGFVDFLLRLQAPVSLLRNGVSTKRVWLSPYSKHADCSGTLEAMEIMLELNGIVLNKVTLTYPRDFSRDAEGNYIAKEPVVFESIR
jgi:hypothetical protein